MKWKYETWRKLYVKEEGAFAQLPLFARALAVEPLKICDDQGRIHLGGKEPGEAIAFTLGATQGDRRLLRIHIRLLPQEGYLTKSNGCLIVADFTRCLPDSAEQLASLRTEAIRRYRDFVLERDGGRCRYCGATEILTLDHVVPLSRVGANDPGNLAAACRPCNSSKGARIPSEWRPS